MGIRVLCGACFDVIDYGFTCVHIQAEKLDLNKFKMEIIRELTLENWI